MAHSTIKQLNKRYTSQGSNMIVKKGHKQVVGDKCHKLAARVSNQFPRGKAYTRLYYINDGKNY